MFQNLTLSEFMRYGKIAHEKDGSCTVVVNLRDRIVKVQSVEPGKSSFETIESAYRQWMERDDNANNVSPQTF